MRKITRNKRGWIRIIEAFIAVVLIASVILIIYQRQVYKPNRDDEIKKIGRGILEDFERTEEMRGVVLALKQNETEDEKGLKPYTEEYVLDPRILGFMNERVPLRLAFEVKVCAPSFICSQNEYVKKTVYVDEIIISSTLESYGPRKVKLYLWEK